MSEILPRFEQKNVLVPHETTIIDKTSSVYRKQLGTNMENICDLFIVHHKTLTSRRQVGKPPIVKKRATRHVQYMPDGENEAPEQHHVARRERLFRKHPSSRLRGTNSWSSLLSRKEVDQRMFEAHISKRPTEFHMTSSALQRIKTPCPKGTAPLARQWRQKRNDQQPVARPFLRHDDDASRRATPM